jgi:SAM-dependent methyltransferase
MGQSDFRYARPESYRTPLETLDGPVEVCSFVDGDAAWPDYVRSIWLSPGYLIDLRDAYDRFLGGDFRGTVLEVGCGMGHLHEILSIDRERYTGVDLNRQFLAMGRERYPEIGLLAGGAEQLPFRTDAFDCVVCSDVLIHLEDMRPALRELIRVSRRYVLLRLRSGDGAAQRGKTVYDRTRGRMFNRLRLEGAESFIYYNVLAPEDLSGLLREVGVTEYECLDLLTSDADRLGLTKIFFDARQAKRP